MKAKVIYTERDKTEVDILLSDGGVASIHHTGEYFLTTYYQDRISEGDYKDTDVDVWEILSEGKSYCKEWTTEEEITDEMVIDAISWLGGDHSTEIEFVDFGKMDLDDIAKTEYYLKCNSQRARKIKSEPEEGTKKAPRKTFKNSIKEKKLEGIKILGRELTEEIRLKAEKRVLELEEVLKEY